MQQVSREMEGGGGMNTVALVSHSESQLVRVVGLEESMQQNGESQSQYHESLNDDFLEQILQSNIPNCSWSPTPHPHPHPHDLPSPSNHNHVHNTSTTTCNPNPNPNPNPNSSEYPFDEASKSLLVQHFLLSRRPPADLSLDPPPFESQAAAVALYTGTGFTGSLHANAHHPFHPPPSPPLPQGAPPASASTGGSSGRQRVRARRGQATDPHSIAERLRRERIAERMKALQELVPNANKTDKASMLDEIIDYVKFLQLQVKVLSMSRLGGAAPAAPLVTEMTPEGGVGQSSRGNQNASTNDSMTVTEHQFTKLMEEDMGSAMQYLQGKGLCLMPISLATAISTATSLSRTPLPPTRP